VKSGLGCAVVLAFLVFPAGLSADNGVKVNGLTEPVAEVTLSFDVNGIIAEIHYKEGDHVKKGSVIVELRKGFEDLDVKRNKLIWDSKVEVEAAKVRSAMLKTVYESTLALFKKTGSVSKEELDKKQLEYEQAETEFQKLAVAEKREEMEYRMAAEKRDKMIMKAPIFGTVTKILLDEGETCENRQPVIQMVDTRKCIMVCNIDAPLAYNLKKGNTISLTVPVGPKTVDVRGRIIFISPVVDKASGLVTVKAEFDNPGGSVRPGVTGSMVVPTSNKK
jgi:RND family efflux transporter MFP subunit